MMLFQLLLGAALVSWANVEAFWTVLSLQGGGPATGWVTRGVWAVCLRLPRPVLHPLMPGIGTTIVMLTLSLWIALLWLGWWVLFSADPSSVDESITKQPVGGWGRFYFTGFTVFTLGVGDRDRLGFGADPHHVKYHLSRASGLCGYWKAEGRRDHRRSRDDAP